MKILYAPIHYILDAQNSGSEFGWAYALYTRLNKHSKVEATFITGGQRGVSNPSVISTEVLDPAKLDLSPRRLLRFHWSIYQASRRAWLRSNFDLHHHVLPFNADNSFNLWALRHRRPFVLGPIQSALSVTDRDLSPKDARGFARNRRSSVWLYRSALGLVRLPLWFLTRATLRRAQRIIVINQTTCDDLGQRGIDKDRIVIIPPGIETVRFQPRPGPVNRPVKIVASGYLVHRKGFDLILKAIAKVASHRSDFCLQLVGDGPQRPQIESVIRDYGLSDRVELVGFVPNSEIGQYYREADIFINMSRAEGFATVCLEAMASGLAIVSSRVGGFSDAIIDGQNGYLVDQENWPGLADRVIKLLDNPEIIERFGRMARADAVARFDWDRAIVPQYLNLYRSLL